LLLPNSQAEEQFSPETSVPKLYHSCLHGASQAVWFADSIMALANCCDDLALKGRNIEIRPLVSPKCSSWTVQI